MSRSIRSLLTGYTPFGVWQMLRPAPYACAQRSAMNPFSLSSPRHPDPARASCRCAGRRRHFPVCIPNTEIWLPEPLRVEGRPGSLSMQPVRGTA
jgi:hypothetical protein